MPEVVGNDLTFHVQLIGPEAAPPLAMIHGLLVGNLAGWYFGPAGRLARRHRVLLHDLRGHGRSARAASGYDTTTMTADLEALLPMAGPGPATLIGHSWGALLAMKYALRRPDRVSRLVLIEAPLPPSRSIELGRFMQKSPEEMMRSLPDPLQGKLARGGRAARALLERLRFLTTETTLLEDVANEPDVPDDLLATLTCPVLLVYGDRSSCRPVADRLVRAIPRARLVELSGGHFLPLEAPGPLADALESFCDG